MAAHEAPAPTPAPEGAYAALLRRRPSTAALLPRIIAPIVVLVLVVGAWQARVWNDLFDLEEFTLPLPSQILAAFRDYSDELTTNLGHSFKPAIAGYALGNTLGLLAGSLLVALPAVVRRRVSAAFTAIQALPIIALAPVVALWLGSGLMFKVVVVAILAFPSMMVYSSRGLTHLDESTLALVASYNASPLQVFLKVRLPNALPFMFTALKFTTILALVGVTVSEVLRSRSGLGYEITDALQAFDTAEAWAAVLILGGLGITWYTALGILERLLVPWSAHERNR